MYLRNGFSWQLMLAIGQVIGAGVGLGTHTMSSTASWRIPVAINLVWVVLLFVVLFIVPESPRWLLYKGKEAKAERALNKIHGGSEYRDVLVSEQLAILNKSREEEAEASSGESKWSDLWSTYNGFLSVTEQLLTMPFDNRESRRAPKVLRDRRYSRLPADLWCSIHFLLHHHFLCSCWPF